MDTVPVTVVTGFLGSGKTTLINHLLNSDTAVPTAVIVNELGDVSVDARLVVSAADQLLELSNGCICCEVRSDLAQGVRDLLSRRERLWRRRSVFQRVVVETSGLASPGPVLQTFQLDEVLSQHTRVDGTVAMVHSAHVANQLEEHPEAVDQLVYADRVLLNHLDQVTPVQLEAAEAAIDQVNSVAERVQVIRAKVSPEAVLNIGTSDASRWGTRAEGISHTSNVQTLVFRYRRPLNLQALKKRLQFLSGLRSARVMRLNGIFACEGHDTAIVAHGIYQWLELGPGAPVRPAESELLIIGQNLDEAVLCRGWEAVGGETIGSTQAL